MRYFVLARGRFSGVVELLVTGVVELLVTREGPFASFRFSSFLLSILFVSTGATGDVLGSCFVVASAGV